LRGIDNDDETSGDFKKPLSRTYLDLKLKEEKSNDKNEGDKTPTQKVSLQQFVTKVNKGKVSKLEINF
jgi:hypothetical protein